MTSAPGILQNQLISSSFYQRNRKGSLDKGAPHCLMNPPRGSSFGVVGAGRGDRDVEGGYAAGDDALYRDGKRKTLYAGGGVEARGSQGK